MYNSRFFQITESFKYSNLCEIFHLYHPVHRYVLRSSLEDLGGNLLGDYCRSLLRNKKEHSLLSVLESHVLLGCSQFDASSVYFPEAYG